MEQNVSTDRYSILNQTESYFYFKYNFISKIIEVAQKPYKKAAIKSGKGNDAKKFLKKDHHDTNMVVAIRIRPLWQREIDSGQQEIIRTEDKLLVSYIFNFYFDVY